MFDDENDAKTLFSIGTFAFALAVLIVIAVSGFTIIDTGERGVVLRLG